MSSDTYAAADRTRGKRSLRERRLRERLLHKTRSSGFLERPAMHLVRPARLHLASYVAALERGWSPDNTDTVAAAEELERLRADEASFLAGMEDREASGPPVKMPDGSFVPRLPGIRRWLWDGEFAGSIGFRWQPGTTALPPYCLGHIG